VKCVRVNGNLRAPGCGLLRYIRIYDERGARY